MDDSPGAPWETPGLWGRAGGAKEQCGGSGLRRLLGTWLTDRLSRLLPLRGASLEHGRQIGGRLDAECRAR